MQTEGTVETGSKSTPAAAAGGGAGGGPRPGLALPVLATAQLMVVLDATIVNVALPHIQRALGFSRSGLEWVVVTGRVKAWVVAGKPEAAVDVGGDGDDVTLVRPEVRRRLGACLGGG